MGLGEFQSNKALSQMQESMKPWNQFSLEHNMHWQQKELAATPWGMVDLSTQVGKLNVWFMMSFPASKKMPTCMPNCRIPAQSSECCSSPRCYVGGGPISLSNLCFNFSWKFIFIWSTTRFWFVAGCRLCSIREGRCCRCCRRQIFWKSFASAGTG